MGDEVARLVEVRVVIDGAHILDGVSVTVWRHRHLAVLGPNGAGKTTLLRVLAAHRFPSAGSARVLGVTFGRGDLRRLRAHVGLASVWLDPLLHERVTVGRLVAAARDGTTWPAPRMRWDDADVAAVEQVLARVGAGHLVERRVDTLSQGERQRVRIARALVTAPQLLILDEPFAGLDLGGRELLIADLERLLADEAAPTVVVVSHHLEELPRGVRDVVLLRDGRVVATGPAEDTLRDDTVSRAFGVPVGVSHRDGRWTARMR